MKKRPQWMILALAGVAAGVACLIVCVLPSLRGPPEDRRYLMVWPGDPDFGPGRTVQQTAAILVHDSQWGGRAVQKAISHGDDILPWIRKESRAFQDLDGRNSFWIAEVLGAIKTGKSRAVLEELYGRADPLAHLVGATGLAEHGALPDEISEDCLLVKTVRADPRQRETHLAIIALGRSKSPKALPCLIDLLKRRPIDYWHHAYACRAIARIGSAEAVPILRDCLQSEEFYAFPEAFRALVTLGDRQAVPLAIARVTPELKQTNSGFVVEELAKVTGKRFEYDRQKWESWWKSVEDTWEIPRQFLRPFDEQEDLY